MAYPHHIPPQYPQQQTEFDFNFAFDNVYPTPPEPFYPNSCSYPQDGSLSSYEFAPAQVPAMGESLILVVIWFVMLFYG